MGYHADPGYLRFRRNSVQLASATSVLAAAMVAAYVLATWHTRPHRPALLALVGVAVLVVVVIQASGAHRLVETRWCDLFFGAWSTGYVAIIVAFGLLDSGTSASSPLLLTFFPVLAFAGTCYPLRLALYVGVCCVAADAVVGLATATSPEGPLYSAGCLTLTAVMCAWQAHTLTRQRLELAAASRTDYLTGVLNRRAFQERAETELARAERAGASVGVVLVDLDDFKGVNDRHGHATGDELLRWVAARLADELRPSDAAARLGGDEFALLLPDVDLDGAGAVAARLQAAIGERTSASLGVAARAGGSVEELLLGADTQLYRQKALRRDVPIAL